MKNKKQTQFKKRLGKDNSELFEEIDQLAKPQKVYKKITRKKPGEKSKNYFTLETQEAIIKYQKIESCDEKNKLYLTAIYPAFDALVENLINVYGFTVVHESRLDLKSECLEFLYTTLPKFKKDLGSLAFSYFNVVAKNWLTIKSKTNAKRVRSYISIDDVEAIGQHDLSTIENYKIVPAGDELMFLRSFPDDVRDLILEMETQVKSENEKSCVKSINLLLNNLDEVDFLSKRALLIYLRETTKLNSKQLSVVLASLKKHYKEMKQKQYREIN